jgi:hypothetical protein
MENKISFNNEELKVLSDKLSKFGDNLSEKERGVLNLILTRASGSNKLENTKAVSDFTGNKDTLINLANAIEGKKSASADPGWFFGWTYNF